MDARKGYYSLIQYCPDPSRLEAANLGVLLFCPEAGFLEAQFVAGHERLRRFFGPRDWSFVAAQVEALEERLTVDAGAFRTLHDLEGFIDRRANELRLTAPRPMKVRDAERDLEGLFARLVGEGAKRERSTRAKTLFDRALGKAGLKGAVQRHIEVQVPSIGHTVRAPYGYCNGRFNLIEPVTFGSADDDAAFARASAHAVAGDALFATHHDSLGDLQLVVVAHFSSEGEIHRPMVRSVLADRKVKLFMLPTVDGLLDDIRQHARRGDASAHSHSAS